MARSPTVVKVALAVGEAQDDPQRGARWASPQPVRLALRRREQVPPQMMSTQWLPRLSLAEEQRNDDALSVEIQGCLHRRLRLSPAQRARQVYLPHDDDDARQLRLQAREQEQVARRPPHRAVDAQERLMAQ